MQNVRTTARRGRKAKKKKKKKVRKIFFSSLTWLCAFAPRRTLVVVALVHRLEQFGVFVNHSRRSNRRRHG
jgi:hypothetical protein